jgi:uncharacterized protein YndB with AHSA1/START domain
LFITIDEAVVSLTTSAANTPFFDVNTPLTHYAGRIFLYQTFIPKSTAMTTAEKTTITVATTVNAKPANVWAFWTKPEHITNWNNASPDWHSPSATNDLRVGGQFNYRMEARDGSMGFDFKGEYTRIVPHEEIAYVIEDGRTVTITFTEEGGVTRISESFEAESTHSEEMQRSGWQAILDNFKQYVESAAEDSAR